MPLRAPVPPDGRRFTGRRGSVLLTAMLFAAGIALVLGSFLTLSRTSLKVAHRGFFAHDAANLAEAGLEEALYSFNLMAAGTPPATAWSGWTLSGTNAMRTLTPLNRDQNAIGLIKVHVSGYDGSNASPFVIAQATVTPFDGGAPVSRTVQLALKKKMTIGSVGLVAMNGIEFKGKTFADSFNSNPSGSPTGPWRGYSSAVATPGTSVAVLNGTISVASGKIYGDLYLGAGVATPPASDYTGTVTTNYTASYPMPAYPDAATVSKSYDLGASIPAILPVAGHLPASDGRYYYFCRNTTIGTVTISAGKNVTIVGTNTSMGPGLSIPAGSSCNIYMDGTVTLTKGADLNNAAWAGASQIFTTTTGTCRIGNSSQIVCCLYAPYASLIASGGGSGGMLIGYYVASTISVSGSMDFHYDHALKIAGSTVSNSYEAIRWLAFESAADRATVAGLTGGYLR